MPSSPPTPFRALAVASLVLAAAACDDPSSPRSQPSVDLRASRDTILVGDTVRFTVESRQIDSATLASTGVLRMLDLGRVYWSTSEPRAAYAYDPGVATFVFSVGERIADTVRVVILQPLGATVAAGTEHSCALAPNGLAFCWGWREVTGTTSAQPYYVTWPHKVGLTAPLKQFTDIVARGVHTCGLEAGTVSCWGRSNFGQTGYAPGADIVATPLRVLGLPSPLVDVTAGYLHGCAVPASGPVWCWGGGLFGATGHRATAEPTPREVAGSAGVVQLGVGGRSQCGIDATGRAWCWGYNLGYQLGRGTPGSQYRNEVDTVARPVASTARYATIASNLSTTCALRVDGGVDCWGEGYLGNGVMSTGDSLPQRVAFPVTGPMSSLALASEAACALDGSGAAWCWGHNEFGQLGDGTMIDRATPVPVRGTVRFTTLAGGSEHFCGGATDGRVYCWGANAYGQLGDGTTTDRLEPTRVAFQP